MFSKPRIIYILILLWLTLSTIFVLWGGYSLYIVIRIPEWSHELGFVSQLHFGFLFSTIAWFVFSSIFVIFTYGTWRRDHWVWSAGVIFSTIFLAIFGLMLASFMVTSLMFRDFFSIIGLVTVVLSFITDLGIVFFLTRPVAKNYFEAQDEENNIILK
jgi:hypothetical protein